MREREKEREKERERERLIYQIFNRSFPWQYSKRMTSAKNYWKFGSGKLGLNKLVHTTTPVAGGWVGTVISCAGAVMRWAGAC